MSSEKPGEFEIDPIAYAWVRDMYAKEWSLWECEVQLTKLIQQVVSEYICGATPCACACHANQHQYKGRRSNEPWVQGFTQEIFIEALDAALREPEKVPQVIAWIERRRTETAEPVTPTCKLDPMPDGCWSIVSEDGRIRVTCPNEETADRIASLLTGSGDRG